MSYTRTLPAEIQSGENKGKTAYVQITNEKLGFPKDSPLKIEQARFKYPQFGPELTVEVVKDAEGKITSETEVALTEDQARIGLEEFVANAGSAARALEIVNDATRDAALYDGKNYIRLAESGDADTVTNVGLSKSAEFTWKAAERVTVKELKAGMDSLRENFKNLTPEQIAAQVAQLLKIS